METARQQAEEKILREAITEAYQPFTDDARKKYQRVYMRFRLLAKAEGLSVPDYWAKMGIDWRQEK